jgi:hypothetical protein
MVGPILVNRSAPLFLEIRFSARGRTLVEQAERRNGHHYYDFMFAACRGPIRG